MDLILIIGITVFFGMAALSAAAQRNAPPAAQVIVVRADQIREREGDSDMGFGILLLLAVIFGAIWLL
jgi:hypothetical protein